MKANAVIGYRQLFDLEGDSGLVARGIGTAAVIMEVASADATPSFSLRSAQQQWEERKGWGRKKREYRNRGAQEEERGRKYTHAFVFGHCCRCRSLAPHHSPVRCAQFSAALTDRQDTHTEINTHTHTHTLTHTLTHTHTHSHTHTLSLFLHPSHTHTHSHAPVLHEAWDEARAIRSRVHVALPARQHLIQQIDTTAVPHVIVNHLKFGEGGGERPTDGQT